MKKLLKLIFCLLIAVAFSWGYNPPDASAQPVWSYIDSVKAGDSTSTISPPATFTAGTVTLKAGASNDTVTFQSRVSYTNFYVTQQVVDLATGSAVTSAVVIAANTTRQFRITNPVITGFRVVSTSSPVTAGRTDIYWNFLKAFY